MEGEIVGILTPALVLLVRVLVGCWFVIVGVSIWLFSISLSLLEGNASLVVFFLVYTH